MADDWRTAYLRLLEKIHDMQARLARAGADAHDMQERAERQREEIRRIRVERRSVQRDPDAPVDLNIYRKRQKQG